MFCGNGCNNNNILWVLILILLKQPVPGTFFMRIHAESENTGYLDAELIYNQHFKIAASS